MLVGATQGYGVVAHGHALIEVTPSVLCIDCEPVFKQFSHADDWNIMNDVIRMHKGEANNQDSPGCSASAQLCALMRELFPSVRIFFAVTIY